VILHRYFARRFFVIFLLLAFVLFALIALVDLVDQTRSFGSLDVSFAQILTLTFLNVPQTLNQILPLIVILSTVALFINFARSSELVITRASGRSGLTSLASPAFIALLIGGFAVVVLNPIVAGTSKQYDALAESFRTGGASSLSISSEGLWLRQGNETQQTVINAERSNSDGSVLYNVTFIALAPNQGAIRRTAARTAALEQGGWQLTDVKRWPLAKGVNPEGQSERFETLFVPTTLTLERIRDSLGRPNAISIWDLPEFIEQLEQAGFSSRKHKVYFQAELARPIFLVSMVLVGAAFTMRHARFGGTGGAVLSAVLLGFALYFVRSFAQILGDNGQIPIALAAWAPPIAGVFLGLGLLLHAEDG
jgi:lipopolysaccharide export system permease protein